MKAVLILVTLFHSFESLAYTPKEDQAVKYYISTFMVNRFLDYSQEQFYGPAGKSPKNEKDLLALCSPENADMRQMGENLEDKKNVYNKAKTDKSILQALFHEQPGLGLNPEPSEIIRFANQLFDAQKNPSIYGFCDLQGREQGKNCIKRDDSCPQAAAKMNNGFKVFASRTNVLKLDISTFCKQFFQTWINGQAQAIAELKMCRRDK